MSLATMNEATYTSILRSIQYLFKQYSDSYAKAKKNQALYYQRNKAKINAKKLEKYHNDPEFKQKSIKQSVQWNKLLRVRSQYD